MARAPTMNELRARLDLIQMEIEKLRAQESLLLEMMQEAPAPASQRAQKGSVKKTVIDLLEDAGAKGLNANSALGAAKAKGIELERGSVSSLLSRLKSDGAVVYDGEVYRLTKFARDDLGADAAPPFGTVRPIRTSGDN